MKIAALIKENLGGLIFSIILIVIMDIMAIGSMDYGAGRYIALNLLFLPLMFIAWIIGNTIRKALHPNFVITNGFWGLLKEKIFWRIGPQVILTLITLAVLSNMAESSIKKSALNIYANQLSDEGYTESTYSDGPVYVELTREQFIDIYAEGAEFIETDDIERAITLIRRGNKHIRIIGSATHKQIRSLLEAQPSKASGNSMAGGVFLDLSGVSGWAADYKENDYRGLQSHYVDFLVLPDEFTEISNHSITGSYKAIFIPQTVTKFENEAIYDCDGLIEIVIPPAVTAMEGVQFNECDNLSCIYFSQNSQLKTIGTIWISLPFFNFPPQLESINSLDTYYITELDFPETIKKIGRLDSYESKLHSVIIRATTPPEVTALTFPKTIENIYVPAESLKAYEDAWFEYEFTFNNQLKPIK